MPRPHLISGAASAAAVLLAAIAVVTTTSAGMWSDDRAAQLLVDLAIGVACPLAATLVLMGRAVDRGARALALVLLVSGVCSAAAAATTGLALAATDPGGAAAWWVQLQAALWVPGFLPLMTLVPLLYPDGLLPGRLWRAAAYASVVGTGLLLVGVTFVEETFVGRTEIEKPVTGPTEPFAVVGGLLLLPCAVLALVNLLVRLRRSTGLRRRQVVVLLVAAAVVGLVTALQGVLPSPADVLVQAVAVLLPPLAIAVAVTRHRLYELDLAVCRALAGLSLSVCLVGAYLSLFALLQAATGDRSAVSAAVAAGVAGVVMQPLGRRLTAGVDRLYFGHRADPYVVTSRLAARLAAPGVDVADVPGLVCAGVVEDLRLPGAEVWLASEAGPRRAALAGHVPDSARYTFPLRHRGEVVGRLAVAVRDGERTVDERDATVLQAVADQAAPAVAALQLHRELQRGREQLVAAREAERHHLRHELHDGLGATLAGLRLQVETAHDLVEHPTAARLLVAAGESVAAAVAEVRTLSEGLRPPGIDDLGLAEALRALGQRMTTPDLAVCVEVPDRLDLDPAVEVAVHRIASEALANVVKHAQARTATLVVRVAEEVGVTVTDDGVGLAAGSGDGTGLGLASLRRRAEEIGGRAEVTSGPDGRGTAVRARLPRRVGGGP